MTPPLGALLVAARPDDEAVGDVKVTGLNSSLAPRAGVAARPNSARPKGWGNHT
jgi:hypothetical protein